MNRPSRVVVRLPGKTSLKVFVLPHPQRNAFLSYEPIIASGYSSAVLHYIANDRSYGAGELVLVDAAGSTQQYTSDVTRTWPSNGRFTDKQAAIYNAVLNAQTAAASLCRNGAMFSDLSNAARESISSDLFKLGLVLTPPPFPSGLFTLFMPHGLGHSVGLDVHDEGGSISTLLTGMVFTIEPGLYFNKALFTPAAFAKVRGERCILLYYNTSN